MSHRRHHDPSRIFRVKFLRISVAGYKGEPLSTVRLSQLVRDYVRRAEVGKTGACHLFRHTMATAMLENGADIRYIQEMLGHAELSTTQIYTQVSIRRLKAVHTLTHPSAKLERRDVTDVASEEEPGDLLPLAAETQQGGDGEARATTTLAAKPDTSNGVADGDGEHGAAELLHALAREADEEDEEALYRELSAAVTEPSGSPPKARVTE